MATQRPFRFGAVGLAAGSREEWVAYARKVEALGYSTLVIGEHLSFGGLGPIAALMAAADATTTLRLGSHVFVNDFRHPALLAQEAATIDLLSSGRLEFGIGAGWLQSDYAVAGLPFDSAPQRVSRLEEAVRLIKQLFSAEPVTFAGAHYQVQGLNLEPKPVQRPYPPIFLGGGGRRMLSLAAQEANIVGLSSKGTPAGTKDLMTITAEAMDQLVNWVRQAAGARLHELELHTLVHFVVVTADRHQAAQQIAAELASWPTTVVSNANLSADQILESPYALIGTLDQITEELQARRTRYGVSYITVDPEHVATLSPVVAQLTGQ